MNVILLQIVRQQDITDYNKERKQAKIQHIERYYHL